MSANLGSASDEQARAFGVQYVAKHDCEAGDGLGRERPVGLSQHWG